jgi:WS/DGAT/MGAT family acyltransferase
MAPYKYERLTALDSSFLAMEDPNGYMHIGSTAIYEAAPLRTPEGGVDFERILRATESVLHLIPRYRQKIRRTPIEGRPVWVDDAGFNLRYHFRHTSLPRPGTVRQLKRLSARIMSQHLDRSKPLWEMWMVEGLEGDRFAVITKVHHCMVDGVAGVDLLSILLRTTPDDEVHDAPPFAPRRAPSGGELLWGEIVRRATLPLQAIRDLREFARGAEDLWDEIRLGAGAVADSIGRALRAPSETPLNQPIGSHRRYDWLEMDLREVKQVAKSFGVTLNDVVLATVAGAVRAFMVQRSVSPAALDFRVLAPVSTRLESQRGAFGNRVSAWIVDFPIGEHDPRKRLERIAGQTIRLKRTNQVVAAELLTQLAEWTPSMFMSLAARAFLPRRLPFNMVITNVPGPQIPLYLLGAPMLDLFPSVPITGNLGLGIALFSYDGRLCWGFNADWEQLPDLHDFVMLTELAFDEMREAAGMETYPERRVH